MRVLTVALALSVVTPSAVRATSYAERVIADGAIHYWRFEEVSTLSPAVDEIPSGNGQVNNPGSYQGGITLSVPSALPALDNAAHFDGQNGTHVALGVPQHPGVSMMIEAWVNLDVTAPGTFIPIAARWDGGWELDVNVNTGKANMVVRNQVNGFGSAESHAFTRGEWHHVVGIFHGDSDGGGGTVTIYLDGVPGTSQTIGLDLQDAGGQDGMWYIGRSLNPTSGLAWTGAIDEVAIYPYALTPVQVVQHFLLSRFADAVTSVRPLPPQGLTLHPAVPNPFNPSTTITFLLPYRMNASLIVFDVTGRRVRTLADGMMPAGLNRFSWNGRDDRGRKASSGVYWFRLRAGELTAARSAILLK